MLITSKQEKIYFPSHLQAPYLSETAQNAPESGDNIAAEAPVAEEADAAAGGGGGGLRRFSSSHRIGSLHQFLSPVAGSPPAANISSSSTPRRTPARTPRGGGGGGIDSSSSRFQGQDSQHSAVAAAAAADKSILLQRYREETSWGPRPGVAADANAEATTKITPDWRLRDRMKTVGVGLILALNVGTDPPDVVKPHPCAVLQCWLNPLTVSRSKAKEMIGERLEQQYANARSTSAARPLRYRRTLDPTVEDVRNVCLQLRRAARNDRVLLHYNGHGVPRPTDHGEIWVFDKNHTEYIPLPITDLRNWLGKPSIVVLDCSAAGVLLPFLVNPLGGTLTPPDENQEQQTGEAAAAAAATTSTPDKKKSILFKERANQWVRETIVLAPCGPKELLPMDPAYPADIFTSCLTTPIPMALRWFVQRNPHSTPGLDPETVDNIPGKATDRKTPLGELNWIFTAVTDSIAWNVLPKHLFKRLFRQDLLVASLFRNFLLADRILRHLGCTPVSYPTLPSAADHPLWQSWDLACETLLFQLIKNGVLRSNTVPAAVSPPSSSNNSVDDSEQATEHSSRTTAAASPMAPPSPNVGVAATEVASVENVSSPFFSEQLTAFEVWLDFSEIHKMHLASGTLQQSSPEQLPIVLQVLLFQVHRIRALKLMRRFLDLGPWAVNLSLSLGIYPYVMKLLQSPQYKSLLVSLWASILAFDPSLRVDLLKDGALHHFVQHLMWGLDSTVVDAAEAAKERTLAAFVLSNACHGYPAGQVECVQLNVHGSCCALLSSYEQGEHAQDDKTVELHLPAHFRLWLVICLASMVIDNAPIQNEAFSAGAHQRLAMRLHNDENANVRAAVCYALGCLIGSQPKKGIRNPSQQDLAGIALPQQQLLAPSQASFAQGLVTPAQIHNMVLPDSMGAAQLPTNQLGQAQLRPTFAPTATTGVAGLNLAGPQHMHAMLGGPIQPTTPVATTTGARGPPAFWNQAVPLRAATQAAPVQAPYILQGQPLGAAGFLVGSTPIVGQPPLVNPAAAFPIPVPEPQTPSVFEDRHRLDLDLSCIEMLVKGTEDASVVVRYEACVGLACAVNKYLAAFVHVAGESVAADMTTSPVVPSGLDLKTKQKFKSAWMTVRSLQKDDVFPPVSKAANDIVLFVNENLLRMTADNDQEREIGKEGRSLRGGRAGTALAGISEDTDTFQDRTSDVPTDSGKVIGTIPLKGVKGDLRRVASEITNPDKGDSMGSKAELRQSTRQKTASESKIEGPLVYSLPKSKYYSWQKDAFDYKLQSSDDALEIDPLSPEGARLLYEKRRNSEVKSFAQKLSEHFSCLAPKPPKPEKKGLNFILEEEDEETALAMEEDLSKKKRGLELKEAWLLQNEGTRMTAMVRFHPYEDCLVSCDGNDQISSWDTSTGERLTIFSNGNPEDSRMTATCWINEKSQTILLVGSDDGAVRLWGGLAKPQHEVCSPSLVSAFHALPMNAERRQSGLVCEWQPSNRTLVAAGSSKYINCWDLEAEKLSLQIDTNTAAPITSLTTAWDHDPLDPTILPPTSAGLSPYIVVAGLGDGALRIFDVRSNRSGQDLNSRQSSRQSRRHGPRATQYSEHKSWVVSTAFTNYANKYEIISGTLSGEVKAWDLRMSSSIRTVEVQRSVMTALAVHPRIPIMAAGSHAQFIKLQTPDGDFLQVLRYHEKMANHRIGPVSCVAFHPHKPMLAAGATDNYIGVYAPKKKIF